MTMRQFKIKALNSLFERSDFKFFQDFLEHAQSQYEWATENLCNDALECAYKKLEL